MKCEIWKGGDTRPGLGGQRRNSPERGGAGWAGETHLTASGPGEVSRSPFPLLVFSFPPTRAWLSCPFIEQKLGVSRIFMSQYLKILWFHDAFTLKIQHDTVDAYSNRKKWLSGKLQPLVSTPHESFAILTPPCLFHHLKIGTVLPDLFTSLPKDHPR